MQISDIANMARRVIREQGFAGYQPTAFFPARKIVRTLVSVPDDAVHEEIALRWASGLADPNEEYFVAFRHTKGDFTVVHVREGTQLAEVFAIDA